MRLDKFIVENHKLTRSRASDLIKLGAVKVNDEVSNKPSKEVNENDKIEIIDTLKYVSRAGIKLEKAIDFFNLDFKDKTVLDVGSSTGGFTDVSIAYGASFVYAYDVGKDQMNEELRKNKKILLFEQTNILYVNPLFADICLVDVSFVSIKPIIEHLKDKANLFVMLFKPQFEVGKKHIYGGIVKNDKVINEAIEDFKSFLKSNNITLKGYMKAEIKGKKGNQEYIFVGDKNA